jgi:hypothetical protein
MLLYLLLLDLLAGNEKAILILAFIYYNLIDKINIFLFRMISTKQEILVTLSYHF